MKNVFLAALVVVASASPAAAESGAKWSDVATTCGIAGGDACQEIAVGAFRTLSNLHLICPNREVTAAEIWRSTADYFATHPQERHENVAAFAMAAAQDRFPCKPAKGR